MARERGLDSLDVRAMPLPIANAVAELEAALNPHEERDRLVEVFRATLRCLGGLALAARLEVGPGPKRPSAEVDERLSRLRRQALTDGEWVGLTRELLRPWRDVAGTHPLPVLVDVFVGKRARIHEGLDGLLGMRKRETVAHGTTGTEFEAKAIVAERMPLLVELLEGLSPLWSEARTVVPLERPSDGSSTRQRAWLLHGPTPPRGRWRVVDLAEGERAAPGRPVVVDPVGKVRLSLEPAVLCERASPEMPEDLFFLDGRDKKTAVFTAFPSMAEVRRKDVLEALDRALSTTSSEGGQPSENEAKAPFKGLESFGPEDASFFVGREQLVEELTNRILANPWVTVTGASGSGKTSLLAAGVGPALRARVEREREASGYRGATTEYAVVMLRPGSDPMVALANKLDGELGLDLDLDDRSRWAKSMLDWCAARRRVLVLMVDQAEELVTLCRDAERREAFGALLSELTGRSETPVRVVLSLRVDFMAQVATIRSVGDRYQRATQVVTTPQREDLVRILVEPAARLGVKWEAGLAEEMADAVKDGSSALPLLSFVASELWKRRGEDGVLDRAAYDALGGVGGALGAHADRVVASLTEAQRSLVRSVLLRLITSDGTRDVVSRRELAAIEAKRGTGLVEVLLNARLLSARENEDGEPQIEIAHEALLEHWSSIRAWRDEDRELLDHLAGIRMASRSWVLHDCASAYLWTTEMVARHRRFETRLKTTSLTDDESKFLSASFRQARRARIRRWITSGVGASTLVLGMASIAALGFAIFEFTKDRARERAWEYVDVLGDTGRVEERNAMLALLMQNPEFMHRRGHWWGLRERNGEQVPTIRATDHLLTGVCYPAEHADLSADSGASVSWTGEYYWRSSSREIVATRSCEVLATLPQICDRIIFSRPGTAAIVGCQDGLRVWRRGSEATTHLPTCAMPAAIDDQAQFVVAACSFDGDSWCASVRGLTDGAEIVRGPCAAQSAWQGASVSPGGLRCGMVSGESNSENSARYWVVSTPTNARSETTVAGPNPVLAVGPTAPAAFFAISDTGTVASLTQSGRIWSPGCHIPHQEEIFDSPPYTINNQGAVDFIAEEIVRLPTKLIDLHRCGVMTSTLDYEARTRVHQYPIGHPIQPEFRWSSSRLLLVSDVLEGDPDDLRALAESTSLHAVPTDDDGLWWFLMGVFSHQDWSHLGLGFRFEASDRTIKAASDGLH